MSSLQIRPLRNQREFLQCEQIQKAIWGTISMSQEMLIVVRQFGGVVLAAFERKKVVGFLCGFLGRHRDRKIHWSFQMAVRPGYQDQGLGFRMKLAHRRLALEDGIRSVYWTFDPLQPRNAALNVGRLGALPEEYFPDYYGRFPSRIESGVPSDRFLVHWSIASRAVERRLKRGTRFQPQFVLDSVPAVNLTETDKRGFPVNRKIRLGLPGLRLRVEIPPDTDRMRRQALPLALAWRRETRRIFTQYLARGYRIKDFLRTGPGPQASCFYMLERSPSG